MDSYVMDSYNLLYFLKVSSGLIQTDCLLVKLLLYSKLQLVWVYVSFPRARLILEAKSQYNLLPC